MMLTCSIYKELLEEIVQNETPVALKNSEYLKIRLSDVKKKKKKKIIDWFASDLIIKWELQL